MNASREQAPSMRSALRVLLRPIESMGISCCASDSRRYVLGDDTFKSLCFSCENKLGTQSIPSWCCPRATAVAALQ